MIRQINHDRLFLAQPSVPVKQPDLELIEDLKATVLAHQSTCVGMAANMIGKAQQIMVILVGPLPFVVINPRILDQQQPYDTAEGCLSLSGEQPTRRYTTIELEFFDEKMKKHHQVFSGFVAQIIQHEMDHFAGRLI